MAVIHFLSKSIKDVAILSGETVLVLSQNIKMLLGDEMPRTGSKMQKSNESQRVMIQNREQSSSIMDLDFRLHMVMSV